MCSWTGCALKLLLISKENCLGHARADSQFLDRVHRVRFWKGDREKGVSSV